MASCEHLARLLFQDFHCRLMVSRRIVQRHREYKGIYALVQPELELVPLVLLTMTSTTQWQTPSIVRLLAHPRMLFAVAQATRSEMCGLG
jgi:hypothetical protein